MEEKSLTMAKAIAQAVSRWGGRTFFVGGFVRDRMLGRDNKDVDIEVHGITPQRLEMILNGLGECMTMGASFGVFGLKHYELDIAMPRQERAMGRGHKDFTVDVDPFLGVRKAALRRDFTINALMEDVLTGKVIDSFGGLEDLRRGIIRHVSAASFVEDPLRVLRAAQFAARFEFGIAQQTQDLIRTMDLTPLSRERVMGEMTKALLKAARPSIFFEKLRAMDQLSYWFKELKALIGVEQDPAFHPEGDVWTHTMRVLDEAAALRDQAVYPLGLMIGALTHDLGKQVTTRLVDGHIHAYGHEKAGIPLAKAFVSRLTGETKLMDYVLNMILLHMRPNQLVRQHAGSKAYIRLFDCALYPEDLLLLAQADHIGTAGCPPYEPARRVLQTQLQLYHETMDKPYVKGADLIEAGLQPGPAFKNALTLSHQLRLAGVEKQAALAQVLASMRSTEKNEK